MTETKPYCTCVRNRQDGFTRAPDGSSYFVHAPCMKPTKFVYEKIALPKMLIGGEKFDAIIADKRIFMERVEARTEVEQQMLAEKLGCDIRMVKMIWEQNE